ncbi:MAG: uroporphyrinogen-III synthase [Alphaproteobacteria bacterium]|nr:uroporphyrinogen-III synthase [Alphaproteobacteria bacterium]
MANPLPALILTRPDPENAGWQRVFSEQGYPCRVWPLIQIGAMPDGAQDELVLAWRQLSNCRAAMFVSRPAVHHFFACRPVGMAWPPSTRAWCTGPGTRQALLDQGLGESLIDHPATGSTWDTEHLWPRVAAQINPLNRVLFVRGTDLSPAGAEDSSGTGVGRDWLAQQVTEQGGLVVWAVAYQRACPVWSVAQRGLAREAVADGSVWLFSSAQALRHLRHLMPDVDWGAARAIATHARIARMAQDMGFGQVMTSQPSTSDVLVSLKSLS